MRVVFFGTPLFASNILEYLLKHGVDIVAVVTKPDRPQGRSSTPVPTPVKSIALSQTPPLPCFQPEIISAPDYAPILTQFQADLFVVVAYGEIIKQHLLDIPKTACINLHTSLLPKFRGAAPIQRSIINGETVTGVTIIHMSKKMDAGDIISTVQVQIGDNTTYGELEAELCQVGSELLLRTIRNFEAGKTERTVQDPTQMTLAPKIELEDCEVHWNLEAKAIHNLVRGVTPHPGAWCRVLVKGEPKRLKIISTEVGSPGDSHSPGNILSCTPAGLLVGCKEGSLLLKTIQLEGKKAMPAQEFFRGMPQGALQFISTVP